VYREKIYVSPVSRAAVTRRETEGGRERVAAG